MKKWFKKITYKNIDTSRPIEVEIDMYKFLCRNTFCIPENILLETDYKKLEVIENMNKKNI